MPDYKYSPEYCKRLLDYMSEGLSDPQIAAKFEISIRTLSRWKEEHPEFLEAYEIGDPKRFNFLMEQGDRMFLTGELGPNDKGYKHWLKKLGYMYRDYDPQKQDLQTININNMSVSYEGKSLQQLEEILNNKLEKIQAKTIEVQVIEDKNHEQE